MFFYSYFFLFYNAILYILSLLFLLQVSAVEPTARWCSEPRSARLLRPCLAHSGANGRRPESGWLPSTTGDRTEAVECLSLLRGHLGTSMSYSFRSPPPDYMKLSYSHRPVCNFSNFIFTRWRFSHHNAKLSKVITPVNCDQKIKCLG